MAVKEMQNWWDQLQAEADRQSDQTDINGQRLMSIATTAALDRVARTGLGAMVCSALAPMLLGRGKLEREAEKLRFYARFADNANLDETFIAPPSVSVVEEAPSPLSLHRRFAPKGVNCRYLSFSSPFSPLNPALADDYLANERNRTARALHFYHDKPRATLLYIHGQSLDNYRINNAWFSLAEIYDQGYDVLMMTLPHHGQRAESSHPISGIGFYTNGLAGTNEAMLQSISDARVWLNYLFDRGAPQVGVSGVSLGGYLSALLACVDDRLSFAIPNSPVVAPVDMALQWQPVAPVSKLMFAMSDLTMAELRHCMALHSPLTYQPRIANDRLFIISGAGDRFTSPRFVRLLHEHWQGSRIHWFPGNHLLHLEQGHYLRDMHSFIDRSFGIAP